jgi:hypothetical protein
MNLFYYNKSTNNNYQRTKLSFYLYPQRGATRIDVHLQGVCCSWFVPFFLIFNYHTHFFPNLFYGC